MKKYISSLVVSLIFAGALYGQPETVNGVSWGYWIEDYEATIGGSTLPLMLVPAIPKSTSGELEIPSELGGYPVTKIGQNAFVFCKSLTSVKIPSTVKTIDFNAFFGCSSLKSVTIPRSVTKIGGVAFAGCPELTDIYVDRGDSARIRRLIEKSNAIDGKRLFNLTIHDPDTFSLSNKDKLILFYVILFALGVPAAILEYRIRKKRKKARESKRR